MLAVPNGDARSRNEQRKAQADRSSGEALAGVVERVTFHNAENGFCVLRIAARGHRDLVTLVGHAATIAAGEWITAAGEWVNDRTHGQQFRARYLRTSAATSTEGIEKYLASGMIRGIGFKTADAIAMKLGIEKTATVRVRAGISYALTEAMDEGHCGLPLGELLPLAERLLEVPPDLIRTAIGIELQDGTVVADRI